MLKAYGLYLPTQRPVMEPTGPGGACTVTACRKTAALNFEFIKVYNPT